MGATQIAAYGTEREPAKISGNSASAEKDASENSKRRDVGEFKLAEIDSHSPSLGVDTTIKYIDPS